MTLSKDNIYSVQSVERTLLIMEALAKCDDGIRVKDLAEQLHLHLSTIHRLVSLLEHKGYAEQDPETKKYFLGLKVLELQGMMTKRMRLVDVAVKEIKHLVAELKQTTHLAVLSDADVVYLDSFEGSGSVISRAPVGKRVSIHSTALGKVLTAWLPAADVSEKLKRKGMERMTPHTVTEPSAYIEQLEQVRIQGYSIDRQEHHLASCCIAAPIRDYRGIVVAAVSVSVPSNDFNDDVQQHILRQLLAATQSISGKLGNR